MVMLCEGHYILRLKVKGRKGGQRTWKKQVEDESEKIVLKRKDVLYSSKWSVDVNKIAAGLR